MIAVKIYSKAKELGHKIRRVPDPKEVELKDTTFTVGEMISGSALTDQQLDILAAIDYKDMDRMIQILKEATINEKAQET